MSAEIKPYRISVGDDVLLDLKSRLRNTRWPEAELVGDWSQGAPLNWIKDVCRYWAEEYDWRAREARLNRFAQFTTEIDGLDGEIARLRAGDDDNYERWRQDTHVRRYAAPEIERLLDAEIEIA